MTKKNKRSSVYAEPNLYVRKEMRTHLGNLSLMCFGARGKWRKIATRLGLDVFDVKEQMEKMIKLLETGKYERKTTRVPNRIERRYYHFKRKKVRPRKTQNVPSASGSADGISQSNDNGGQ